MTFMEFTGCALIAFGPALTMFSMSIAHNPIFIIIMISAAFFWLLSLLLSSLLWTIVIPLKETLVFGVVFSVLFQELFRYLFYRLLKKAEMGLKKVSEVGSGHSEYSTQWSSLSYVSGFGFGIMSGVFSMINVLADSTGPGTVGLFGDSRYFFITSAFHTLAFVLLHTFWGIIFFHSLDSKNYLRLMIVPVSHLVVTLLTFLNQHQIYTGSLIPCYIILFVMAYLALRISQENNRTCGTV
ncbi:gamma-secretase subunit Aph-1 [Brevipalpus obovatus]|uniref:gamma-secretase subunit Aph-1 n=1 Tax=Brevipalpus obovatus TaxID=246614 RepID=UPI003D9EEFBF